MGVLPCHRGGAEAAAALPRELHVCVHTDSADAPDLLLLGDHAWQGQLLIHGGVCRGDGAFHVSPWKENTQHKERETCLDCEWLSELPDQTKLFLKSLNFRLSSEASLCFINKYYLGQGIEPEIFKFLMSSLTAKVKIWYLFPAFVFCACLVHL